MITGEYPPQHGGVSDYSRVVARGLAGAGDEVQVYAPECTEIDPRDDGITIHRSRGAFGPRGLVRLARLIGRRPDQRLLVQYVPHAFGFKAMNLPFCLWLYAHARRNGGVTVMFHEVQLGVVPGASIRHRLLDAVTGVMAKLVARSAAQIFVSTPAWEALLRHYISREQSIAWLPVPSAIPPIEGRARVAVAGRAVEPFEGPIIGHFGTYPAAIAAMLRAIIPRVLASDSSAMILLIGANGDAFRQLLVSETPALASRIVATGALPVEDISLALSSCDVMMQPYPDGVSARRSSIMAALGHARAIVTTLGSSTEPLWSQSESVTLVQAGDIAGFASAIRELSHDPVRRCRYATAAKALYMERFDARHIIEALRASACV
jgi:glycosyltransferase involved in cell wall biosynthesis